MRKGALRVSTFAMWGIPMANDITVGNLTVVQKLNEPLDGKHGKGYRFMATGEDVPPDAWFTWWNDDGVKLESGKTYKMAWFVTVNGQWTNRNIQWANLEDEPDKNKPDKDKPDESELGITITAEVGQGESDDPNQWDIPPSGSDDLFDFAAPATNMRPDPRALGMCQNNVVELVAAGLIPLPEDVKGQKDKIFCFIKNLRDEMYEATAGQMFRSSHYCKAHKATRQMGKNGKWFHPLMEEHDETPAPDTELRVEGKRYCVQGQ